MQGGLSGQISLRLSHQVNIGLHERKKDHVMPFIFHLWCYTSLVDKNDRCTGTRGLVYRNPRYANVQ